jgi:hypothetical protein
LPRAQRPRECRPPASSAAAHAPRAAMLPLRRRASLRIFVVACHVTLRLGVIHAMGR